MYGVYNKNSFFLAAFTWKYYFCCQLNTLTCLLNFILHNLFLHKAYQSKFSNQMSPPKVITTYF